MNDLSNKLIPIFKLLDEKKIESISLDVDGTLYPMRKVEWNWWKIYFTSPFDALKFLTVRKYWEKKRKGSQLVTVSEKDVQFFEKFLLRLLSNNLVPFEIHHFLKTLQDRKIKIFFLSDHGTEVKLMALGLTKVGTAINCLSLTGELKPHAKISELLTSTYQINPKSHLHLGDRWTDEEQARLLESHFHYLTP